MSSLLLFTSGPVQIAAAPSPCKDDVDALGVAISPQLYILAVEVIE